MGQYLKDDVQRNITEAALRVFSERGYSRSTVAEIAKAAGVSTGNIYRYYPSKEILFDAILPADFAGKLRTLLRRRVRTLAGVEDIRELPRGSPYHVVSDELLRFASENRLRVVLLLGRAQGSRYESFAEDTTKDLVRLAVEHYRSIRPNAAVSSAMRFNLSRIYRGVVTTIVDILSAFDDEAAVRDAIRSFSKYHLAGMKSFFG